jgi:hypothetical protein
MSFRITDKNLIRQHFFALFEKPTNCSLDKLLKQLLYKYLLENLTKLTASVLQPDQYFKQRESHCNSLDAKHLL